MLRQVAEGVLIHQSDFIQTNAVVVHGRAGVLLIDPGRAERRSPSLEGTAEAGLSLISVEQPGGRPLTRANRQQLVDQRQHFRVRLVVVLRDRANSVAPDEIGWRSLDQCHEPGREQAL